MEFWLLPWIWEEDANASKLLGLPSASNISTAQMETLIHEKIDHGIHRLQKRQLSLAGRALAANSLILSTIWYMVTLWAGDFAIFAKLQKKVEEFLWAGRSRVCRTTTTQSKANGGLGLLLISEQYQAIVGNLMLWVLGPDPHPLRSILCSHIRNLSQRKWGFPDFTWIVAKGGGKNSDGSATWRNICVTWDKLKIFLVPTAPSNLEFWGNLPLWCPHLQQNMPSLVRCSTQAQH